MHYNATGPEFDSTLNKFHTVAAYKTGTKIAWVLSTGDAALCLSSDRQGLSSKIEYWTRVGLNSTGLKCHRVKSITIYRI